MAMQNFRWFNITAGVVFSATGVAKIISAFGKTPDLTLTDPIFDIQFRKLMLSAGLAEIILALLCFQKKNQNRALGLTAWMALNYLLYHVGEYLLHWHKPCICMGYLAEGFHMPAWFSEWLSEALVIYLIIGSYGMLSLQWWKRRAEERTANQAMKL
ncbi:MAG: hypothetical protein ACLQSR_11065 [Limisphaerales bacterium]